MEISLIMDWNKIFFTDFEYGEEIVEKLYNHSISFKEAVECFFNDFQIRRNKSYNDRFQLIGKTNSGRKLCIIFQLKENNVIRIITGWGI